MVNTKLPETIGELCDYIKDNASRIFIREQIDGKWGAYALSDLSVDKAIYHTLRFVREGRIPVILKGESDVKGTDPDETDRG